eukprot:4905855-Amphidinium_carterae.1
MGRSSTSVRCDEACAAAMLELSDGSDLALRTQSYDVKRMIKSLRAIPPAIEEKARVSGQQKKPHQTCLEELVPQ